jgi:hypothetical protein
MMRSDLRDEFAMAEEAFALSPISARAASPSEADYDAIREAFMETSRGRWFLDEYGKRNRNADTRMVLDAIARIEATVVAQKQQQPTTTGLLEAMGKIRSIVSDSKASAAAAMATPIAEDVLTAAREGARIIREIAWTLRECGADTRICDLLDTQIKAIDASQQHDTGGNSRAAVLSAFDLLLQNVEALAGDVSARSPSNAAAAPDVAVTAPLEAATPVAETSTSYQTVNEALTETAAAAGAGAGAGEIDIAEPTSAMAQADEPAATVNASDASAQLIVEDRSQALDDIAIVDREALADAEATNDNRPMARMANDAAPKIETADAAEEASTEAEQQTAGDTPSEYFAAGDLIVTDLLEDQAAEHLSPEDVTAEESITTALPTVDFATQDTKPEEPEAAVLEASTLEAQVSGVAVLEAEVSNAEVLEAEVLEAEDMAVLDMVALEMAEPDLVEAGAAEPDAAAASLAIPDIAIERETVAAAQINESVSVQAETPLAPEQPPASLGAALIANGVLANPALPAADSLGPIRRMSQADKIAFFA